MPDEREICLEERVFPFLIHGPAGLVAGRARATWFPLNDFCLGVEMVCASEIWRTFCIILRAVDDMRPSRNLWQVPLESVLTVR